MNIALILAAGVGQRMRNAGLPKQFLKIMGKPIIVYTIEKFMDCEEIDSIVIAIHGGYVDYMQELVDKYQLTKVRQITVGGNDRQESLKHGLDAVGKISTAEMDIVVVHDGVRPLVTEGVIRENISVARQHGCALTVHAVKESVVITDNDTAGIEDFKERAKTYTLTSPQSFQIKLLQEAFATKDIEEYRGMPLLDAAMVYAKAKGKAHLVKEQGANIKITTPEDFYYLKATLELEEQKYIFGL